jgi:hypothetical protein
MIRMQENDVKDFFNRLRRSTNISYFIASIIPLSLLVYFSVKYVYPYVMMKSESGVPIHIGIILLLAVLVSVLGLTISIKTTKSSITSVQNLHTRLNSLIEITKQFRSTPFLDVLLEEIVKSAIRLNSAEAGSLLLYDGPETLKFKVALGKQSRKIKDRIVKRGEGVSGWVADKGEPVIMNDVKKDSRYSPDLDMETGFQTRSIMCVPLMHKKEVIGVIEILNRKNGVFTKEDESLLFSLADQAAISIVQSKISESQQSDLIQITSILVETQDHFNQVKTGHARNVSNYANLIGKHMKLSEKDLKNIYYASLFHDIGFLRINLGIKEKLNESEIERVRTHPQIGYEIIKSLSIWSEAAELILNHHERFDGKGYPNRRKGDEIPLGARIIFVADTFDVLTSKSSYKPPVNYLKAIEEIEAHSGTQFDPEVVEAFKAAVHETGLV